MTQDYNLRDPFGYSAINTPLAGASEFDGHAGSRCRCSTSSPTT